MDNIVKELCIPEKNIVNTPCPNTFVTIVHYSWLKSLLRDRKSDGNPIIAKQCIQTSESVHYPWKKIFIRILEKKLAKVLPLPRSKIVNGKVDTVLTFTQLLQYVAQTNQRNLWKETYKRYTNPSENQSQKEISNINLVDHDHLLSEVIMRLYGCNIIKVKNDSTGLYKEYSESPLKHMTKSYDCHPNMLPAICALETDKHFYIIHNQHMEYSLLDCLTFSPALLDSTYARGLFIVYQLLQMAKSASDRGLSLGDLTLQNIYLTEDLWVQVVPEITNNIHALDTSLIYEHIRNKMNSSQGSSSSGSFNFHTSNNSLKKSVSCKESIWRNNMVHLEKMCDLWVRGRISNLDYILYLNELAGRSGSDPQAHYVVPWVTDFTSRCGRNWRDLTKSKFRLTKGDRQLDMTYDILGKESNVNQIVTQQIPHHVSDVLSDITYYVYMARRTPKSVLCKYVRNNWVPAEYPISIQRMQEWTPDECIPEFYTDPSVFKSLHEDLPDLEVPSWATCVEDFIVKHREALESTYVSDNLHHWIDLTFGYKLSGSASIKSKNVCLSLVDRHTALRRGGAVQLLIAPHPARLPHPEPPCAAPHPPRVHFLKEKRKLVKSNDSSEELSEDEQNTNLPQHVSRLSIPRQHSRSRKQSSSRNRSYSKSISEHETSSTSSHSQLVESRNSSTSSRHLKVQKSDMNDGVIYLPKEYNPISMMVAVENINNFKMKSFFTKSDSTNSNKKSKDIFSTSTLFPSSTFNRCESVSSGYKGDINSDENSFTNHMFVASYEQAYLRKHNQEVLLESPYKERKNRSYSNRFTTDSIYYKQFVTENRKRDMLVIGCLIVEIFLHNQLRPLRTKISNNFKERYECCRLVLKHNYHLLPKCLLYIIGILLNVEIPFYSTFDQDKQDEVTDKKFIITNKGLPTPSPSQLLQPLLASHLIPFPSQFSVLYNLVSCLHEYRITEQELNMLCMYECDGLQCDKYENVDKTKFYFEKKISEGKVQACSMHLETFLNRVHCYNQFNVIDLFLPHFIQLLDDRQTSILAAWYLFDAVSKALGPTDTSKKLLRHILNLYDDENQYQSDNYFRRSLPDTSSNSAALACHRRKSVKLYHNIFLLQLIVRFGLQCFLDHFTQHLVEAVGGYKDVVPTDNLKPTHRCNNSKPNTNKKIRYHDESMKAALSAPSDILSPDTSYGSEQMPTPSVERMSNEAEQSKIDVSGHTEVFLFENEPVKIERNLRIESDVADKSPSGSSDSYAMQNTLQALVANMDIENSPNFESYFNHSQGLEAREDSGNAESELALKFTEHFSNNISDIGPISPTIPIPNKSTIIENCSSDEVELRDKSKVRASKSLESGYKLNEPLDDAAGSRSLNEEISNESVSSAKEYKISEMSSESLIWLAHRLGPVLTCRYVTRNLLKMLTLCYIGKENLVVLEEAKFSNAMDSISIANSAVVGDKNALKVINCLTSIVALYGEQLILLQYLPHMGDLIASCRRRLSAPLEGGLIACLQLLRYLVPFLSDVKLMEQLQDVILKNILHPTVRLLSTTRSTFPNGVVARSALACKFLDALYVVAVRIGPEMTRKHLCVPALQRFFLAFDKATGKTENWPKPDGEAATNSKTTLQQLNPDQASSDSGDATSSYIEICRDGSVAEWCVRGGEVRRGGEGVDNPAEYACSPPLKVDVDDVTVLTAQEELASVFCEKLAHQAFVPFYKFVGFETMERSLKNVDTINSMCDKYDKQNTNRTPCFIRHRQSSPNTTLNSPNNEGMNKKMLDRETEPVKIGLDVHLGTSSRECEQLSNQMTSSNSFGSNFAMIGNRIEMVHNAGAEMERGLGEIDFNQALDIVSCKMDNGVKSNRHLRGDWLIYWEHEIGRPDKENRFNLKQIKLQTFSGHTHSIKCIHCLDNENSFMSGSKDKTVRLWSLRNQGDGSAVSPCHWTYTGHRKGVLSLTFLESLRLAVSTDSIVHIWDPYMESVVSQLDSGKSSPVSIVKAMPAPSVVVLAATTDSALRMIDARTCTYTHDLKVTLNPNTFVRCMCVSPSGRWVAIGLATGHMALLDPRTGLVLAYWKAHEGEILQLVTINEGNIVSSSLDQTIMVWSTLDGKLKFHLKGSTEPVHCLAVYCNELISATTNNRIGVHTAVDQEASFSSTKLRSDTFKGVLTAMSVLPLNRLLLLGGDGGNISLLC